MSDIILIQGSLRPGSRTALVVQRGSEVFNKLGIKNEIIDLRDFELPFCDGRSTIEYGQVVVDLYRKLENAKAYVIASPVYAYTYSGVVKNFIDIFGGAMKGKFSGVIYNASGANSYLAAGELVKIMAYDFNHTVVMPTVYTHKRQFVDGKLQSEYVENKLNQMIASLLKFVDVEAIRNLISN